MKKTVISIVAVLVIIAVIAGSFWAGMSFGQARANQGRQQFRGPGGQGPGLFGTPQPGQTGAERLAGGVMGTIEAVEGDTLVVTTQEGTIRVQTTDTTMIEKYTTVAISDLDTARSIRVLQIPPTPQSQ
jgi:hypothetical protein